MARHLEGKELRGKTVTVKARLADFTTFTRQTTLSAGTDSAAVIQETAWRLFSLELTPGRSFRLLGVGVSGFSAPEQLRGQARHVVRRRDNEYRSGLFREPGEERTEDARRHTVAARGRETFFDLVSGVVGTTDPLHLRTFIRALPDGWFRISVTFDSKSGATPPGVRGAPPQRHSGACAPRSTRRSPPRLRAAAQ